MNERTNQCECLDRLLRMKAGETPYREMACAAGDALGCTLRGQCQDRHLCSERASDLLRHCLARLEDPGDGGHAPS